MDSKLPLKEGWIGNIDAKCNHRWRVLPTTEQGFAQCEHCGVMVEQWKVLDMVLVAIQDDLQLHDPIQLAKLREALK